MEPIKVEVRPKMIGPVKQVFRPQAHTPRNTAKFYATVVNDPVDKDVTWEIYQGGGEINELGVFFPPEGHGKSTVAARSVTDRTKFDTAVVTYDDRVQ